ncbi:MAG: hypothetical protein ACSLE1_16245 [Sphingobium sp.]
MSDDAQTPLPLGMADTATETPTPAATKSGFAANTPPPARAFRERRRSTTPLLIALVIFAFLGGIGAAVATYPRLIAWWGGRSVTPLAASSPETASAPSAAALPVDAARQDLLALRMTELEDRLARVSVATQAASGNATRSEGLLVAFATRRALDSGATLGYLEGQLRLRFGQAQPRAVATIINAAREPVTLTDLQAGFDDIAPSLRTSPPGTGWWTALQREARDLVIIRKASTPSPLPERAIPRIARLLSSGRVAPAMEEVERLPGKANAERWLEMGRRYREARRALDLIETAAILDGPPVRPAPTSALPAAAVPAE